MLLVINNGSVFTPKILEFLLEQKIPFTAKDFDNVTLEEAKKYDSIILSGRRKNNPKMNALNSQIILHCISENKSLLGICYGAEILAITLGGTIRRMDDLQKGEEDIHTKRTNPLFQGTIKVFESHQYEIAKVPDNILELASSKNCKFEVIQVKNSKLFGTQFHPEMTSDGKKIIQSFTKL